MNSNPATEKTDAGITVSPAMIGCFVLLVSFFLPWINFLGMSVAGYQVGKLSSNWQWLWAIPVISGIAILVAMAGRRHIEIAQVAGGLPLVGLGIAVYQHGTDLFPALLAGAWSTLASGAFLLCVAPFFARKRGAQTQVQTSLGSDNR